MPEIEFRYFFDPLCGWCYASAPALAGIEQRFGGWLTMLPTGLFFEPRPVTAIADHAWRNDQRISALTKQHFSQRYHDNVLHAPDGVFTSGPLTVALAILGELDASLEPRFLHAAQLARYVEGKDTSRIEEVVKVAQTVAIANDTPLNEVVFAERLRSDATLLNRVNARMAAARSELQAFASGVPQLVVRMGDVVHVLEAEDLYGGKNGILTTLERVRQHQ